MLFIDEVHRFSKSQQDVLLPAVEDGLVVLIGATTENPFFEVNPPLLSRASLWRLHPLSPDNLRTLIRRGLDLEGADAEDDAIDAVVAACEGDARAALTTVETAVALARGAGPDDARVVLTMDDMARARDGRLFHQGADEHYDQISALIKSVRGSDPDAGLYWMARMIEAGEDPRFLARRMVILASEDIGLADPQALLVAEAAARAVEYVGLPEAALNLAEAVIYLARAPKSNAVVVALGPGPGRRALERAARRSRRTCATPTTRAPPRSGTARATSTPMTTPPGWSPSSIVLTRSRVGCTTSPRRATRRARAGRARTGRPIREPGAAQGRAASPARCGGGACSARWRRPPRRRRRRRRRRRGTARPRRPAPGGAAPARRRHASSAPPPPARCSTSTWSWPGRTRPAWPRRWRPCRPPARPTTGTT